MLNHPYVVAAFEGAGAMVGIALGTKHMVKELLLCALGSSTNRRHAAKVAESQRDTEWAYVKVQMGAFSPSKGSIKAPTTPEPCTPRLPSGARVLEIGTAPCWKYLAAACLLVMSSCILSDAQVN